MPASIHPEMKLSIVLDEESFQGDADAEIERCFTAVAPTEVVRAEKGSQRANVLEFDVGMGAVDDYARDPLWENALATWLDEEFAETSALVARENDARRSNGERVLPFTWAEVRFGGGPAIAVRMVDSSIPAAAAGFVGRARTLLREGALGADPIEVIRIPACASIAAQREEAAEAGNARGDGNAPKDYGGARRNGSEANRSDGDACGRDADASSADADERAAVRAIGEEERGSSSAFDIEAAVTEAAGIDDGAQSGWEAADPDAESAWAGSQREQEGPTRAELDDALAEAEAALRRGSDPADAFAEERAAAADAESAPPSVITDGGRRNEGGDGDAEREGKAAANPSSESCALSNEDVPDTLDYRIWNVIYADGTSVRFDSVLGEAILD